MNPHKPNPNRRPTIRTFDDFVEESEMLPDGREPDICITDPLEQFFFDVADKHGIIDRLIDGEEEN